jgi:quinol monooxygenase YgiN
VAVEQKAVRAEGGRAGVTRIGRFVRMRARAGAGDELQELMLRVAATLEPVVGCELYVVCRSATEPDTVWVSECWAGQEALEASVEAAPPEGVEAVQPADVFALLTGPPEVIAVSPVAGVGLAPCST